MNICKVYVYSHIYRVSVFLFIFVTMINLFCIYVAVLIFLNSPRNNVCSYIEKKFCFPQSVSLFYFKICNLLLKGCISFVWFTVPAWTINLPISICLHNTSKILIYYGFSLTIVTNSVFKFAVLCSVNELVCILYKSIRGRIYYMWCTFCL